MKKDTTDGQLNLLLNHADSSLRQYLEERLNRPVALVLTENSTSMLSARERDNILRVRLHKMFVSSGTAVIDEIVSYLKHKSRAMPLFRKFLRDNRGHLHNKSPNRVSLKTSGKFHDLRELYEEINASYFGGMISSGITWGSGTPRCSARKRTLGSYSERSNTIRINPILDRRTVPRYYVAFVVYHEMLHAAMGMPLSGTRRSIHSREFRKRERLFKDYERAAAREQGRARQD
jgi:hypothetical protein